MNKRVLPIGTIFMVLVIFLALLGVGYALWSETLTISGTVQTGEVDVALEAVESKVCVDIWGVGKCQDVPPAKQSAATCDVVYSGPDGDSNGDDGSDQLLVTVNGMYPSWHCKVSFKVKSIGNVPVHVALPEKIEGKDNPAWVATNFETCYADGVQLHQGDTTGICTIDIHFTNDQAPQENSGPYTFGWSIKAVQWNEDGEPVFPPEITPGYTAAQKAAGTRIKGWNTGKEIFIGPMLDGSALPRNEAEYNEFQTVGSKTYSVTFSYDKTENKIATTISSPDASAVWDFDTDGAPGCTNWNVMDILVRDSRTDSGVALQNVKLNSYNLGNLGTVDKAGTPGWQNWTVTGFDFTQDFTITADLVVDGYTGNESIKVEFTLGCLP